MMSATTAMTSSAPVRFTTTMRCSATTAARCSATHAGRTPCGVGLNLSTLLDAAEGARTHSGLTRGRSVSSRRLPVPVERTGRCTVTGGSVTARAATCVVRPTACAPACVVRSTARAPTSVNVATAWNSAACSSTSVIRVPVVKGIAPGVVPRVVIDCVMVVPIESPMVPAPPKTSKETDPEADSERKVWAAIPNSGIRIPSRPGHDGASVNHPGVVRGNVNDLRIGRLNDDRRPLRRYHLLRRSPKIAGSLRPSGASPGWRP